MSRDLSQFDIRLESIEYKAVHDSENSCTGCCFSDDDDLCVRANSIVDCFNEGVVWVKKEQSMHLPQTNHNPDEEESEDIRSYNVGNSNYAKHKIQPWDIWLEYKLNPWDADIVKRVLRHKEGDSRQMDYEKIIHICKERIRQLGMGLE